MEFVVFVVTRIVVAAHRGMFSLFLKLKHRQFPLSPFHFHSRDELIWRAVLLKCSSRVSSRTVMVPPRWPSGLMSSSSAQAWVRFPLPPRIFSGSSHISDLKMGFPVAILPDTWSYWASAGTGWPGAVTGWRTKFDTAASISVRKHEQIPPWGALACCWDVKLFSY